MVNAVTYYEDASGKPHKLLFDAHRADLAILFAQGDDMNEASAKKLAARFTDNGEECDRLIEALQALQANRPAPDAVTPAPVAHYED